MMCSAKWNGNRAFSLVGWLTLMLVVAMFAVPTALAAPVVTRTTPIDGEILQRTPTAVGIGFNVPLDRDKSSFRLLTIHGEEVQNTSLTWGSNDTSVTINLPREFPDGVYTITWNAVGASDGEVTTGWSSFSVGNPEDANIITIPTSSSGHVGPPTWLHAMARGVALVGLATAMAIWPIWRGIIRPALGLNRPAARRTTIAVQRWTAIAIVIATIGSLAELTVRALIERDTGLIDAVMLLLGTNWGFWWIVRVSMLSLLGIGLAISGWWWPHRARFNDVLLWILSFALPLPLVFSGHSVDDSVGRLTSGTSAYLFLLGLGMWAGGAMTLFVALRFGTVAAKNAVPLLKQRIGWFTLTSALIIGIAGLYLGWSFAGNLSAITDTTFGQAMIPLVVAGVISVVVGLLISRSIPGKAVTLAGILCLLTIIMLFSTAQMDVRTPAREQLLLDSTQTHGRYDFDGISGIVLTAPGRAGVNHMRLETPGRYLQGETEVFLVLSSPTYPEIGTKTTQMYRVQGNAYEHHGTEFSLIGEWNVTVRIEEPGLPPRTASYTQQFGEENTSVDVPGAPWKFKDFGGLAGVALGLIAVLGISTAVFTSSTALRKEAGGLALVAAALATVVILQGRFDPILVVESGEGAINPNDVIMVTRGKDLFNQHCASCHGEGLRGDGPLAEALIPPPTDFSAPHARVHPNADLIYWIQYGIQGTAMPGFRVQLEDQDIRDIIAYIQNWQQNNDGTSSSPEGTPQAAACEVTPTDFVGIRQMFHHGLHEGERRGTPMVRAADPNVNREVSNEVVWTLEQLVNCANQDQYLSQIRLLTPALMQEIYPLGASWEVTSKATADPRPLPPSDWVSIRDVQSITLLADGRIAVTVIFDDPAGIGVIPGADPVYQVTLIMIYEDGIWLIDEVR